MNENVIMIRKYILLLQLRALNQRKDNWSVFTELKYLFMYDKNKFILNFLN